MDAADPGTFARCLVTAEPARIAVFRLRIGADRRHLIRRAGCGLVICPLGQSPIRDPGAFGGVGLV